MGLLPVMRPDRYQDVKAILMWYTAAMTAIFVIFLFLPFVLPPQHRANALNFFQSIAIPDIVGWGLIVFLIEFTAWFLVFGVEIHDKVYDRHIVRWRYYYDLDYILPFLVRPFTHRIDSRFFETAEKNKLDFMKVLYYEFVGDDKGRVSKNAVVRFYEAVVKYWVTQINELFCIFSFVLTFVYFWFYRSLGLPIDNLIGTIFLVAFLFAVNRYAVRRSRQNVRPATADEIKEIHQNFAHELEDKIKEVHAKYGLTYS